MFSTLKKKKNSRKSLLVHVYRPPHSFCAYSFISYPHPFIFIPWVLKLKKIRFTESEVTNSNDVNVFCWCFDVRVSVSFSPPVPFAGPSAPLPYLPFLTMHPQRTHKKIIVHKNKKIDFSLWCSKSFFFNCVYHCLLFAHVLARLYPFNDVWRNPWTISNEQ